MCFQTSMHRPSSHPSSTQPQLPGVRQPSPRAPQDRADLFSTPLPRSGYIKYAFPRSTPLVLGANLHSGDRPASPQVQDPPAPRREAGPIALARLTPLSRAALQETRTEAAGTRTGIGCATSAQPRRRSPAPTTRSPSWHWKFDLPLPPPRPPAPPLTQSRSRRVLRPPVVRRYPQRAGR